MKCSPPFLIVNDTNFRIGQASRPAPVRDDGFHHPRQIPLGLFRIDKARTLEHVGLAFTLNHTTKRIEQLVSRIDELKPVVPLSCRVLQEHTLVKANVMLAVSLPVEKAVRSSCCTWLA